MPQAKLLGSMTSSDSIVGFVGMSAYPSAGSIDLANVVVATPKLSTAVRLFRAAT